MLIGAIASPASAFSLFGITLFGGRNAADANAVLSDPQPYTLDFSTSGAEGALDTEIRNASALVAGKDKPASGTAGLVAKARGDYRSITAALYSQGYYGGTVNILIGGRQASTVRPDASLPKPVAVKVVVDPGAVFRFGALSVANGAPAKEIDTVQSLADAGFAGGKVARSGVVLKAEQLEVAAWKRLGYALAEAGPRQVVADHSNDTVSVKLAIVPGRKAAIGPVSVSGTEHMDPAFVARQTGLVEGGPYTPNEVARAEKRLTRLGVFKSERIVPAKQLTPDGQLPFEVVVQEQELHRIGVGATYSTIDGLGTQGYWLHRNLFGKAEQLRLDAKVAGIAFPIDSAQFDYAFGGTFTKPGLFNPDTDLVASVSAARTIVPTYRQTSIGGKVGLTHSLSDAITFEGDVLAQQSEFVDDFGTRHFTVAGVSGSATFDNRDSKTDPTSGYYLTATVAPFYEFHFGNPAVQATAEARGYLGFGEHNKFVLAGRVKVGALAGPSLSEVPPDQLFFAGGGGSVRGYAYQSIGVTDSSGNVTGGRYLLEGSIEGRMKINDSFGAAAFLDGGYVAADTFPGIDNLRLGAGVGLRYYTGFGPIRLDLAVPLNRRPGDARYAIYAGLGQAF